MRPVFHFEDITVSEWKNISTRVPENDAADCTDSQQTSYLEAARSSSTLLVESDFTYGLRKKFESLCNDYNDLKNFSTCADELLDLLKKLWGILAPKNVSLLQFSMNMRQQRTQSILDNLLVIFVPSENVEVRNYQIKFSIDVLQTINVIISKSENREFTEKLLSYVMLSILNLIVHRPLLSPPTEDSTHNVFVSCLFGHLNLSFISASSSHFPSPRNWRNLSNVIHTNLHYPQTIIEWSKAMLWVTKLFISSCATSAAENPRSENVPDGRIMQLFFKYFYLIRNTRIFSDVETYSVDFYSESIRENTVIFKQLRKESEFVRSIRPIESRPSFLKERLSECYNRFVKTIEIVVRLLMGDSGEFTAGFLEKHFLYSLRTDGIDLTGSCVSTELSTQRTAQPNNSVTGDSLRNEAVMNPIPGGLEPKVPPRFPIPLEKRIATLYDEVAYGSKISDLLMRESIKFPPNLRVEAESIMNMLSKWVFSTVFCELQSRNVKTLCQASFSYHKATLLNKTSEVLGNKSSPFSEQMIADNIYALTLKDEYEAARASLLKMMCLLLTNKDSGNMISTPYILSTYSFIEFSMFYKLTKASIILTEVLRSCAVMLRNDIRACYMIAPALLTGLNRLLTGEDALLVMPVTAKDESHSNILVSVNKILISILNIPYHRYYSDLTERKSPTGINCEMNTSLHLSLPIFNVCLKVCLNSFKKCYFDEEHCSILSAFSNMFWSLHFYRNKHIAELDEYTLNNIDHALHKLMRKLMVIYKEKLKHAQSAKLTDDFAYVSLLSFVASFAMTNTSALNKETCVEFLLNICNFVKGLIEIPDRYHIRKLHNVICAGFYCISCWLIYQKWLLSRCEILKTAFESLEMGIAGIYKAEDRENKSDVEKKKFVFKPLKPVSYRVSDIAVSCLNMVMGDMVSLTSRDAAFNYQHKIPESCLKGILSSIGVTHPKFTYLALGPSVLMSVANNKSSCARRDNKFARPSCISIFRSSIGFKIFRFKSYVVSDDLEQKHIEMLRRKECELTQPCFDRSTARRPRRNFYNEDTEKEPEFSSDFKSIFKETVSCENNMFKSRELCKSPSLRTYSDTSFEKDDSDASRLLLSQLIMSDRSFTKSYSATESVANLDKASQQNKDSHDSFNCSPLFPKLLIPSDGKFEKALKKLDEAPYRQTETVIVLRATKVEDNRSNFTEGVGDQTVAFECFDSSNESMAYKRFISSLGSPVSLSCHRGWAGCRNSSSPENFEIIYRSHKVTEMAIYVASWLPGICMREYSPRDDLLTYKRQSTSSPHSTIDTSECAFVKRFASHSVPPPASSINTEGQNKKMNVHVLIWLENFTTFEYFSVDNIIKNVYEYSGLDQEANKLKFIIFLRVMSNNLVCLHTYIKEGGKWVCSYNSFLPTGLVLLQSSLEPIITNGIVMLSSLYGITSSTESDSTLQRKHQINKIVEEHAVQGETFNPLMNYKL